MRWQRDLYIIPYCKRTGQSQNIKMATNFTAISQARCLTAWPPTCISPMEINKLFFIGRHPIKICRVTRRIHFCGQKGINKEFLLFSHKMGVGEASFTCRPKTPEINLDQWHTTWRMSFYAWDADCGGVVWLPCQPLIWIELGGWARRNARSVLPFIQLELIRWTLHWSLDYRMPFPPLPFACPSWSLCWCVFNCYLFFMKWWQQRTGTFRWQRHWVLADVGSRLLPWKIAQGGDLQDWLDPAKGLW